MTDTALLAVLLAGIAGLAAGRVWAAALRRGERYLRAEYRDSTHYTQGLHYATTGQIDLAISELGKVAREDPEAVEVLQVLGNLLREKGQTERAIQTHQALLARPDLTRGERAHALASLGTDFRKAGFLDRADSAFNQVLDMDPKNIHALVGLQKLHEEQRDWRDAYEIQTRLSRLRKSEATLALGYLQAEMGREAAAGGRDDVAEKAFKTALSLDRRVFPAHLGLAEMAAAREPRKAAALLEEAIQIAPDRAYLAFEPLARAYAACGEPSRFVALCESIIRQDPRDWRARLALARHLRGEGRHEEALGLLLRAVEQTPQGLLVHLEVWRTLRALGLPGEAVDRYFATAEQSAFYRDPHVCMSCRYRADDMLWRCPHCHEWNTFVEERLGPPSTAR